MAFADEAVLFRGWVGELGLVILEPVGAVGGALDWRAGGIGDRPHRGEVVTMHEVGHAIQGGTLKVQNSIVVYDSV